MAWTARSGCKSALSLTLFEGSDVSLQVEVTIIKDGDWWRLGWLAGWWPRRGPPGHSALMPLTLPLVPIRKAGHTV